ncbi:MAG: tRNA (cytidine(34)-2'-O)-methyltransferase [Deltaproteobacteria bacterium]|nr:tRNA (cytidine(34)-2'-O)-methyltransferase [Deltaproteobacteria bacterium]
MEKTAENPAGYERHVVLVAPQIHWNTGNAGRTCLAAGARLHLVRPLGFSLDESAVRRAGLDYWDKVPLSVWDAFGDFLDWARPEPGEVAVFSKNAPLLFWSMPRKRRMFLVFGSETQGLPPQITNAYPGSCFHIPVSGVRSINLSTTVGIALYESLRGLLVPHAPDRDSRR